MILPHTCHFTGFVSSVPTDCVSVKCEDAFTQYLEDYSTWQIGETRTNKSCSSVFEKDGKIKVFLEKRGRTVCC